MFRHSENKSELNRSLDDEFFSLENSVQPKFDEFKQIAVEINLALSGIFPPDVFGSLNMGMPRGILDLIHQYADVREMEFGKLQLTLECRQVLNALVDDYLLKESEQIDACSKNEAEQRIAILTQRLMYLRTNQLPTNPAPDQYFFMEQYCLRYIFKLLKSPSLELAPSERDQQGILKAIHNITEANEFISLELEQKKSTFSELEWLSCISIPAFGFFQLHSAANIYASTLPKNSTSGLQASALKLLGNLWHAADRVCYHEISEDPNHYMMTRDYTQMDLLTRIALSTLKLMHQPSELHIKQYHALRRETARYSNLKLVCSSMAVFAGAVLEAFIILPKLGLLCCGKTTAIRGNFILHKSITFFQQSLLAKQMDRVLAGAPTPALVNQRSWPALNFF